MASVYIVEEKKRVDRARAGSNRKAACLKKASSVKFRRSGLARAWSDGNEGRSGGEGEASGNKVMTHYYAIRR